jgi:hypothetical protein
MEFVLANSDGMNIKLYHLELIHLIGWASRAGPLIKLQWNYNTSRMRFMVQSMRATIEEQSFQRHTNCPFLGQWIILRICWVVKAIPLHKVVVLSIWGLFRRSTIMPGWLVTLTSQLGRRQLIPVAYRPDHGSKKCHSSAQSNFQF